MGSKLILRDSRSNQQQRLELSIITPKSHLWLSPREKRVALHYLIKIKNDLKEIQQAMELTNKSRSKKVS